MLFHDVIEFYENSFIAVGEVVYVALQTLRSGLRSLSGASLSEEVMKEKN